MRWLRLGLGIIAGIQAILFHDTLLGFFSAFLLFQTVTNTGCCGAGACTVPKEKINNAAIQEIEFEEEKGK